MIHTIVKGVSRDDTSPSNSEDEASREAANGGRRSSNKQLLSRLDSSFIEGTLASTVGRRLHKKRNFDFLLRESDVVMEIPNDDTSKQSEGMDEEEIEQPREPKEEPEHTTVPSEGVIGKEPELEFQIASNFASPLVKDNLIVVSYSSPMMAPGLYISKWRLTRDTLLMQHYVVYEWGCHAFLLASIEDLELLSNSHMSNSLRYAANQAAPYLVATARCLHQVNSDSAELASAKAERDQLKARVMGLEEEKRKFEECYELLASKKVFVEE